MRTTINLCKTLSSLFVFMAFQPLFSFAQKNQLQHQFQTKANLLNSYYPQEKIYLQLDRPSYWANEDIWFKAYLKDSPLSAGSLYVELLNPSGTIVQKKILWVEQGLAYGDFHVEDTLSSGVYQMRAYTNWMRNFDDNYFFRKNLIVWNQRNKTNNSEIRELKVKQVDLQFFPEGGTLISNVQNKIAFKAIDQNGKGLDLSGKIVDDQGNEITSVKSNFKGMGSFVFKPQDGRKYFADVMILGRIPMKINLPDAQSEGVKITIDSIQSKIIHIAISERKASDAQKSSDYVLIGRSAGTIFYQKDIQLNNANLDLELDKSTLPTGIVQFTLFDSNMIPHCERLIFVNNHDYLNIDIQADKTDYLRRETVQLKLSAFDKSGNPAISNLSISAYNDDGIVKFEYYPDNIISHFLLSSELKGKIEDPAYYFKDDSINTTQSLDNLMLTHGYRYFDWKEIKEDKYPEIDYPAEESVQIRGTVKSIFTGKPIPDCNVTMMTVKSLLNIKEQKTDSLGRFVFSELYFNDTLTVSLQALNQRGKHNTEIILDERSSISPEANNLPKNYHYKGEDAISTAEYYSEENSELINKKWSLSDTILLGGVKVTAFKQKKDDGHVRMYKEADFVFDMSKQDDIAANIYDAIDGRIPGVRLEQGENVFYARGAPVLLYLNGTRVDDSQFLATFPPNMFDKVEYVKSASFAGINKDGGILFFYSKRGAKFENKSTDKLGMKSARIMGYSVFRKFYSPKYESNLQPEIRTDFRGTLYWNPIVKTDSIGTVNVSFCNSDQTGDVQVIVEGITSNGKLCRGVSKYHVKP